MTPKENYAIVTFEVRIDLNKHLDGFDAKRMNDDGDYIEEIHDEIISFIEENVTSHKLDIDFFEITRSNFPQLVD